MKLKMYTMGHDIEILKKIDSGGGQFTAEEHEYAIQKEFGEAFETRESLMRWYFRGDAHKLCALAYLIRFINDHGLKNVISLGAGACVLEYVLRFALPEDAVVVAADFDSFMVERARLHLPGITPVRFDFFKDDIVDLGEYLDIRFDLAVFFAAAYVMDDNDFIRFFGRLREAGIKFVVDFHGGFIDFPSYIANSPVMRPFKNSTFVRRLFGKAPIDVTYKGKFHGYARSRRELRRLYRSAGFEVMEERSVEGYKYVAVCRC